MRKNTIVWIRILALIATFMGSCAASDRIRPHSREGNVLLGLRRNGLRGLGSKPRIQSMPTDFEDPVAIHWNSRSKDLYVLDRVSPGSNRLVRVADSGATYREDELASDVVDVLSHPRTGELLAVCSSGSILRFGGGLYGHPNILKYKDLIVKGIQSVAISEDGEKLIVSSTGGGGGVAFFPLPGLYLVTHLGSCNAQMRRLATHRVVPEPGGVAFSGDGTKIYFGAERGVVMVVECDTEGFTRAPVRFGAGFLPKEFVRHISVDEEGNVCLTFREVIWLVSAKGTPLVEVKLDGEARASAVVSKESGSYLFIVTAEGLKRIRIHTRGIGRAQGGDVGRDLSGSRNGSRQWSSGIPGAATSET